MEESAVRRWRLKEERDPDNASNKESLELDDSSLTLDFNGGGTNFLLFPDLELKFTISPFWCRAGSRWRREVASKRAGGVDRDGKFDRVGRADLVNVALDRAGGPELRSRDLLGLHRSGATFTKSGS